MIKKNYNAVDLMKFFASIMVIFVHTYPFLETYPEIGFVSSNIIGRILIPFFFVCSGYFFQKGHPTQEKFKKYIFKLLKLYLIWSILYIPFGINRVSSYLDMTPTLWVGASFLSFLNFGTYFHLWYMAALIFSIVVCYYYLKRFSMKSLLVISSVLFAIGCIETYYGILPEGILKTGINIYFSILFTTRNGIFYGLLFVSMGMAISKYDVASQIKKPLLWSILFFILMCIEAFTLKNLNWAIDYNFYFMVAPFSFFWFCTLITTDVKCKLNYPSLREYSVIIYFSHGIFLELVPMLLGTQYAYIYENGLFRLTSVLIPTLILSYIIKHKIPLLRP